MNPHVPRELDELIAEMMERDPERRLASARDVSARLASLPPMPPTEPIVYESVSATIDTAVAHHSDVIVVIGPPLRTDDTREARADMDRAASIYRGDLLEIGESFFVSFSADGESDIRSVCGRAAGFALAVAEPLVGRIATLAVRGSSEPGELISDIVDDASMLLDQMTVQVELDLGSDRRMRVVVTDVAARLLEERFELRPENDAFVLVSARDGSDLAKLAE